MAIPGVKVKFAPEGSYSSNLPIWLAGQNNGSENGARFNATKLIESLVGNNTGNGTIWNLCIGDPNGTVVARGIGDFTLSNPGGWIYESTAAGNMSWSNQGFSLQGPPGENAAGNGGSAVNQGVSSNMAGLVIANDSTLFGSSINGMEYRDVRGGAHITWPNQVGGVSWVNIATGLEFIINQSSDYWSFGDALLGTIIGISWDGSRNVFFLGNNTIMGDGNAFYPPNEVNLPSPMAGMIAFNYTLNAFSYFDGSQWIRPGGGGTNTNMRYSGDWGSGTSYSNGTVVKQNAALWVLFNGPSVAGDQPLPNDGIWQVFEEAFYQTFIAPGWLDSGTIDLGIMVIRTSPANFTYNSGGNGSFMIIDLDRRLRDLDDLVVDLGNRIQVLEDWKATGAGVDAVVLIGDVGAGNGTMEISVDEGIFTNIVFPP